MDYPTLLLNPQGRIGPSDFQRGALILIAIGFVLAILPLVSFALSFLGILGLVLIYPWAVIWIKRLHDAGQSGWMFIAVALAWFVVSLIVGGIVSALFMGDVAADMAKVDPEDFGALMRASVEASRATILPSAILNAVVAYGFVYAGNMILKSEPTENQYGPAPSGAPADPGNEPPAA